MYLCLHTVQIRDRGFGGDDMGLLDLMPANISPGAISFAIKCMMEGGWSVLWAWMQRLWPSGRGI